MINSPLTTNSILIIGSNGGIGSSVINKLRMQNVSFVGTTKRPHCQKKNCLFLDLADYKTFSNLKLSQYKSALFCGAITSIQACEENPLRTREVNVDGNIALIKLLAQAGIHITFISTNLVFDGSLQFPKPTDSVRPLNQYACQKLIVEEYLSANVANSAIIRFGKVIQPSHPLLLEWLVKLSSSEEIYPYSDRSIAPISAAVAADILIWLIKYKKTGLYQASSSSEISYADIAYQLAKSIGSNHSLIHPMRSPISDILPSSFSTLSTSDEIITRFGPIQPQSALVPVIKYYARLLKP